LSEGSLFSNLHKGDVRFFGVSRLGRESRVRIDGTVWRQGRRHPSLHMDVRFLACSCGVLFYRTRRHTLCKFSN
jgi:hypothetical protein